MSLTSTGFLVNRTCRILSRSGKISEREIHILKRSLNFIDNILKGREHVNTGRLSGNALEALGIYTLIIPALSDNISNEKFDSFIKEIKSEIEDALKKKRIAKTKVKKARMFFENINRHIIFRISSNYYEEVENAKWII